MAQEVREITKEPVAPVGCRHYWVIESAEGPTSKGVCKLCGAEKEFFNSFYGTVQVERNPHPHELPRLPIIKLDEEHSKS